MAKKIPHTKTKGIRDLNIETSLGRPLAWKNLGDYIEERAKERALSFRKLASELEIGPSHLSNIVKGKITPYPDTCKKIAVYFGDPVLTVLMLAGWVNTIDVDEDRFFLEFSSIIRKDSDLKILYKIYRTQSTLEDRKSFVRSVAAAFGFGINK